MKLRQFNVFTLAPLLMALAGCPTTGCTNGAKFNPEQLAAVKSLTETVTAAAKENNVTVQGRVRLTPVDFYAKQSVGVGGLEAEVYFTANPAAQNAADNAAGNPDND